ncbi:transcription initiation factor TFIID subunit 10-like [Diaphorina citri]|uniref:Transcription initiation factor TFIID subunit 10-like n=1 Tax=Diaphorina citri TaxID=121845 RepID=A0A1S3DRF3_DIACI|nr:transcription initiation factor TFIID subunit 10-like [Diaphorina citri]
MIEKKTYNVLSFYLFSYRVRLVALAVQKFISEIANDALQHCKIRSSNQLSKSKTKDKKYTLTMDDLAPALAEYGINIRKPQYYIG